MPSVVEEHHPPAVTAAPASIEELVRGHFPFVWRCLRRLGVAEGDADDAAQQVFLVAERRHGDLVAGSERAFLFRTAANVAAKAHRTRARRREDGDRLLEDLTDAAPGPDEALDQRRARDLLDRLLDEMDPDLRAALVLYEIESLTVVEMADALGVPQGTAASRLRRAREDFTARVRRYQARHRGGMR